MDITAADAAQLKVLDILERVKSVFASKGFDGASMQDLAQAAQMSVGNFYRYFPSKNAIITALVERDLQDIEATFEMVKTSDDPRAIFIACLRERIENLPIEDAALWTEIQSASFRLPEIAQLKRNMEETVRRYIVATLVRIHGSQSPAEMARYETQAHFMMLMIHGFAQRKYCTRDYTDDAATAALGRMVLDTIDKTLLAPVADPNA
ncbi:TetR family transcriptional regulator [Hoeflea marina]|uniref:TetR family transcriptional regulator n=1 Tax=Hoeflea marina TaxID=274592 RepID=A0A317PKS1_9HYPH|nr:TetR/AcrR family transcriptional regulator [Hoeflea marina]PWW01386.1 TetR family transcriptional regulator [Hoeflea marina]